MNSLHMLSYFYRATKHSEVVGVGINPSCASGITETNRIATVGSLLVRKGRIQLSARVSYSKHYSRRIDLLFLLSQPYRFMAKSIDLSIGRMQQRQPMDRQVNTPDDLQPARVNTFRDRLCARLHQQWRFRKEVTDTAHR